MEYPEPDKNSAKWEKLYLTRRKHNQIGGIGSALCELLLMME